MGSKVTVIMYMHSSVHMFLPFGEQRTVKLLYYVVLLTVAKITLMPQTYTHDGQPFLHTLNSGSSSGRPR